MNNPKNYICKFIQPNSWHHKLFYFYLLFWIWKVWKGREKATKNWISWEQKKLFRWNKKKKFIVFEGLIKKLIQIVDTNFKVKTLLSHLPQMSQKPSESHLLIVIVYPNDQNNNKNISMIKNTKQNQTLANFDKQRLVQGREIERLSNVSSIHPCTFPWVMNQSFISKEYAPHSNQ